jgi:phosphomannomutase
MSVPPTSNLRSSTRDLQLPTSRSLWTFEGLSGVCQNELTPQFVHRAAAAFGAHVFQHSNRERPKLVLAGDGRPIAAELLAAAGEAICWAGADVIELSNACAGAIITAVRHFAAQGGLLVGNAPSEPRMASISFFGPEGVPWSLDGSLDAVKLSCEKGCSRPVRTAGSSERRSIEDEYRAAYKNSSEFRRPLRIVFDSACGPLRSQLKELLAAECRLIQPEPLPLPNRSSAKPAAVRPTFREQREKMIARQVVVDSADFGIWIDGIGEACTLIDDRGLPIPPKTLVAVLARSPFDETDYSSDYVETTTREAMFHRLANSNAMIAGDKQGRIWFRTTESAPQLDALFTLLRLLKLLNETSQPLRKLVS